jgi:hypothetical protein
MSEKNKPVVTTWLFGKKRHPFLAVVDVKISSLESVQKVLRLKRAERREVKNVSAL